MIKRVVEVFVDVKMDRADISVSLYKVAAEVGGPELVRRAGQRMRKAVEVMLHTAPHTKSALNTIAIDTVLAAMSGTMRSMLEARPSPTTVRKHREQLVLLCQSDMAVATARHQ